MENDKDQIPKGFSVKMRAEEEETEESLKKYPTQLSVRIDPEIKKSLKFVAVEQDKTLTKLFMEAIQDLLKKYGKKEKE